MPMKIDASSLSKNSLKINQKGMDICAQNLSELETDAPAKQVLTTIDGSGNVRSDIIEVFSEPIIKQKMEALTTKLEVSTKFEAFESLQETMRDLEDENSFYALGNEIASSFHKLSSANSVDVKTLQQQAFSTLNNFINEMKNISNKVQAVRQSAEQGLDESLKEINSCLQSIADYNIKINSQQSGDFTITQRRRDELTKLANYMGFYAQNQSDGTIKLYSDRAGTYTLVDKEKYATFSYTAQGDVDANTTFNNITLSFAGHSCNGGNDVTSYLSTLSGKIKSQIYLRDTLGPSIQSQLNKSGAFLYTNLNEIHNQGTSSVLRNTLTGEGIPNALTITGTELLDPSHMTGSVTFALMNSSLFLAPQTGVQSSSVTVDLSQFQTYVTTNTLTGTITDFTNFLNNQFTTNNVGMTASVSGNQFVLTSTDTTLGIAMSETSTSNVQLNGATSGKPLSEFFGLNNLLSTSVTLSSNDFINNLSIRSDIAANRGASICTGKLLTTNPLPTNQPIIEKKSIAFSIADSLKNDVLSFGSTSTLGAQQKTFGQYLSLIVTNHAGMTRNLETENKTATAYSDSLTQKFKKICKMSREDLVNMTPELAIFRQQIIQIAQTNISMEKALSELRFQ